LSSKNQIDEGRKGWVREGLDLEREEVERCKFERERLKGIK
jgi:hypothetical protein